MSVTASFWSILVIIAIVSYFISRYLLKHGLRVAKHVNLYAVLGTAFIFPVVYIVSAFIFFSVFFYDWGEPELPFSSAKWKLKGEDRHTMSADIIEGKILINKHKTEVFELLGAPQNDTAATKWNYETGFSSGGGFGIEFHYLDIMFIENRVQKVTLREILD